MGQLRLELSDCGYFHFYHAIRQLLHPDCFDSSLHPLCSLFVCLLVCVTLEESVRTTILNYRSRICKLPSTRRLTFKDTLRMRCVRPSDQNAATRGNGTDISIYICLLTVFFFFRFLHCDVFLTAEKSKKEKSFHRFWIWFLLVVAPYCFE